jgi:hypothetical protein
MNHVRAKSPKSQLIRSHESINPHFWSTGTQTAVRRKSVQHDKAIRIDFRFCTGRLATA